MRSVKITFLERVNEVETYYTFMENFIQGSSNDDLNKILKSNLLLMLYNLVESSISNAIAEIHNDIHAHQVSFNALKTELRKILISHLKANLNPKSFVESINDIAIDIIKECFDKSKISNGNIDGRKIRDIGDDYGFSHHTNYSRTKNGNSLVIIKGRRNDLAHGTFSFTEVGKEYSTSDLQNMKTETINYLSEILDNVENYLINQEYRQPVPIPPAASTPATMVP